MKLFIASGWIRAASLSSALLLVGCMAPVGSELEVPTDAALTCKNHCASIGLPLSAVAIMANNVGCVCEAKPLSAEASSNHAVTGGMATIMLQEEARRRQEQQQLRQQRLTQQQNY